MLMLEATQCRGSSIWLTCLPIAELGFALNRQEFRDALSLRYGWPMHGIPSTCACGEAFDPDHAMSCATGGYSIVRHNHVRDYLAAQMSRVCPAVAVEPHLLPVMPDSPDQRRLDIKARGFWTGMQDAFFDVRVFYPCAPSYLNKTLPASFLHHEHTKKAAYQQHVLDVERGSFTPFVLSSVGGAGNEAIATLKRLVALLTMKSGDHPSKLMGRIRCELGFCLLRDALMMLRGSRKRISASFRLDSPSDVVLAESQLEF